MMWQCNNQVQQKWGYDYTHGTVFLYDAAENVTEMSAGVSTTRPRATWCMDTYNDMAMGNSIQLWGCNAQPQQQFDVLWGSSIRVNQNYRYCLDLVGGSTTAGTKVSIWECNGGLHQQWVFDEPSQAIVYGGDVSKTMCLDGGIGMKRGNELMIWGCNGQSQQKWGYDPVSLTMYLSQSEGNANGCLDMFGGVWKNGQKAWIWDCNGCWNQQWILGGGVDPKFQSNSSDTLTLSSGTSTEKRRVDAEDIRDATPLSCPSIPSPGPSPGPGPPGPAPPPPPPSPTGTCKGGWPLFQNQQQLASDAWGNYFKKDLWLGPKLWLPHVHWRFLDVLR